MVGDPLFNASALASQSFNRTKPRATDRPAFMEIACESRRFVGRSPGRTQASAATCLSARSKFVINKIPGGRKSKLHLHYDPEKGAVRLIVKHKLNDGGRLI